MSDDKASNLRTGVRFRTVFYSNRKEGSAFRWRATHVGEVRAPKVILCDDPEVVPGKLSEVRVVAVSKPRSKDRGAIEVEFVRTIDFALDEGLWVEPVLKLKLQALLETGSNILLDGPQGSGKTTLAREVARALDMEYVYFNCASIFEATDFLATLQVRATGSGGVETVWVPSDILRAFGQARQEPDRLFLVFLDELNRCREMARNGIMPALDSTRRMYNPVTGSIEPIPDNVLWIAAINNGAQFTGTTSVDPAQLDRFAPLKVGYPPAREEERILHDRYPAVPRKTVRRLVKLANVVRDDAELGLDLSMRATEEVCTLLSHPNFSDYAGDPLPDLLRDSFCGRVQGVWSDPSTDAGMLWSLLEPQLKT
jgi:MoxR-like ATPase